MPNGLLAVSTGLKPAQLRETSRIFRRAPFLAVLLRKLTPQLYARLHIRCTANACGVHRYSPCCVTGLYCPNISRKPR